ncbi:MAG: glycosyltransferase family protein [Betaproteobacteria bacterium]|nr:glycosyltransferase family protein [Betaproteobacteria bacterium]
MLALLQARCSSSRLPGKVLKPILGEPMIVRHIERLRRTLHLSPLVVATSTEASDDPLAELCASLDIACRRGSLSDVLDRFYQAAAPFAPDHVVRLTGDCPLADPEVIDACIDYHLAGDYDYTSNALRPSFPDGLDVEVFRFSALADAWREAQLPSEREHVTPFLYNHPERYRIGHFTQAEDFSWLRWTVDQPEDFAMVERVYDALYPTNPAFSTRDIIRWLATHPEVAALNTNISRNEGYLKSLAKDAAFTESR